MIGVTAGRGEKPGLCAPRQDYLRSVEAAGAVPVALPPGRPQDASLLLDRLDGLVLSGGGDLDPALYGEAPHPKLGRVERERDDFELALVAEALRRQRPVLAICRGMQLLNVATGGTLFQDLPSQLGGAVAHDATGERSRRSHEVEIVPDTQLRDILRRDTVRVNSLHHQAVRKLGGGLRVAARCPQDQLVEAIETLGSDFVLAVQWHPESFWDQDDSFQGIFDAHAEACRQ